MIGNIFKLLKRHIILGLLILLVLGLYWLSQVLPQTNQTNNTNKENVVQNWDSITPGNSTKDQVIKQKGEPVEITEEEENSVYSYISNHPNFNDKVYIDKENEQVNLIKEAIPYDEKRDSYEFIKQFGATEEVYYAENSVTAPVYLLYVYPKNGVAYVSHRNLGTLLEIWYFEPTTSVEFYEKYISGYIKVENTSY